jgi:hypothetical protein
LWPIAHTAGEYNDQEKQVDVAKAIKKSPSPTISKRIKSRVSQTFRDEIEDYIEVAL